MKECWIFGSAGTIGIDAAMIPENAYIIAADGGYSRLKALGIRPDIVLGDLDSLQEPLPEDCEIITVPCEKDDTDMLLAVRKALAAGYGSITLCGALGGRFDHTFANIQTLEFIAENGGEGTILSCDNIIMLQSTGKKQYKRKDGWYFSIFSLTDEAVVTSCGTKYNLAGYPLKRSFPLGVSNEIIEEYADIEVKKGKLLVVYSKNKGNH